MKKWYYIDYRFNAADRSIGENNRLRQGESKTEKKKTNGFSRVCFRIIRKIVYIRMAYYSAPHPDNTA